MPNPKDKRQVTARLNEETFDRLALMAKRTDRSVAYIVERAVIYYLDNNGDGQLELKV